MRPAPVGLRPFLHFAKLPPRALVAARRALDADDAFRARVADEVSEEAVGRAGWLFLARPDGWEDELGALVQQADDDRARVADHRAEDDARRRLGAAEGVARRAEEVAEAARAEAGRATTALAEERRARRAASREVTELAARVEALTVERDQALAEATRSRSEVARFRSDATTAKAGAATARAQAARARTETADALARVEAAEAEATARQDPAQEEPTPWVDPTSLAPSVSVGQAGADALASAADAARALGDALATAGRALGGGDGGAPPQIAAPSMAGTAGASGSRPLGPVPTSPPPSRAPRAGRTRPKPRVAAPLPPAVFEESSEAAEHLARLPGVVILVDGYNVSHAGWPGSPIAEQRRRLVDALIELAARTGADVRVVFDGADMVEPPLVATTARTVRVSFSPPDVEADDVIVAEVGEIPAHRPVVVASSDRRVRDESRARGANLLRSSQLLRLLRR